MASPSPVCPPGWTCKFIPPDPPPGPFHVWWQGPWGIVIGAATIVAVVIAVWIVAYYYNERARARAQERERREQRQNQLAVEEQRTMQIDAAKGNPESLKIVREMQQGGRYV